VRRERRWVVAKGEGRRVEGEITLVVGSKQRLYHDPVREKLQGDDGCADGKLKEVDLRVEMRGLERSRRVI
jgi:hypothetical protein